MRSAPVTLANRAVTPRATVAHVDQAFTLRYGCGNPAGGRCRVKKGAGDQQPAKHWPRVASSRRGGAASRSPLSARVGRHPGGLMQAPVNGPNILIVYYSRFGVLERLAEWIAEGVGQVPGAHASLFEVEDRPVEELRPGED